MWLKLKFVLDIAILFRRKSSQTVSKSKFAKKSIIGPPYCVHSTNILYVCAGCAGGGTFYANEDGGEVVLVREQLIHLLLLLFCNPIQNYTWVRGHTKYEEKKFLLNL